MLCSMLLCTFPRCFRPILRFVLLQYSLGQCHVVFAGFYGDKAFKLPKGPPRLSSDPPLPVSKTQSRLSKRVIKRADILHIQYMTRALEAVGYTVSNADTHLDLLRAGVFNALAVPGFAFLQAVAKGHDESLHRVAVAQLPSVPNRPVSVTDDDSTTCRKVTNTRILHLGSFGDFLSLERVRKGKGLKCTNEL